MEPDRRDVLRRGGLVAAGVAAVATGTVRLPAARAAEVQEVIPRAAWAQRPPGSGTAHTIHRLTVHHTAAAVGDNRRTPAQLRSIESYHRSQGWPDAAYHLFIGIDGTVYQGRDLGIRGDTFTSYDPTGHLLVCAAGSFDSQPLPDAAFDSMARVLAWGSERFGVDPSTIAGHRAYAATGCPGSGIQARIDDGSLVARVRALRSGGGVGLRVVGDDDGRRRIAAIERGVPPGPPRTVGIVRAGGGYRVLREDGRVRSFGVGDRGDVAGTALSAPIVGGAATPTGEGTWLGASDGGVFALGDAGFHGSAGGVRINRAVVGMAATPGGGGYWLVAGDGGIFAYGDARFSGSTGGMRLNRPVVGMTASPTGGGYWLVASDGGIFAFGDARFHGSTGGIRLNRPIVGMASTPSGGGYWLVADDGGVFAFGDAVFAGSAGATRLASPVVGMAASASGRGYWLVAQDGGVFAYGDAPFLGSASGEEPTAAAAACC